MRKTTPLIERLMRRVHEDENGCWVFEGARSFGYGVIGRGGRSEGTVLTHRATYNYFIGDVPERLDLDHLCRNRACCNPWHLDPVTRVVNVARGARGPGYRDSHCKNGHEYTPENTRIHAQGYRRCVTCLRVNSRKDRAA